MTVFIQELEDFFGGGNTLQSRERSLDILRQTGSVSELAIAFQQITSTFLPQWSDHPLIYVFAKKIKEVIRFGLTARGSVPATFHAYVAMMVMVEQNQAAAASSRSQGSSDPPPRTPPVTSNRPPPPPPSSGHAPMDEDGTRTRHGSRHFEYAVCPPGAYQRSSDVPVLHARHPQGAPRRLLCGDSR